MKIIKSKTGNYSVRYVDAHGDMRSTNLKTRDRREAEKLVKDLNIAELEQAGKLGVLSREVVGKIVAGKVIKPDFLLKEWEEFARTQGDSENTINTYLLAFTQFIREHNLKNKSIGAITHQHVHDFLNQKDGTSLSNRNLRKAVLGTILKFAGARGYLHGNPSEGVKVDRSKLTHTEKEKKVRAVVTLKEYKKIINNAPDMGFGQTKLEKKRTGWFWRHATAIGYWTGLRLSDICSLEWASIDLKNDRMTVWTDKRDKRVEIPLGNVLFGGEEFKKILREILPEDPTYCFPDQHAIVTNAKKRSLLSVQYGRLLRDKLGIDKTFHCTRHSCVTRLKRMGVDLEEIGKVVGHSNVETTAGYAH